MKKIPYIILAGITLLTLWSVGVNGATILFPYQGGTGLSTGPTKGDLMVGSSTATYAKVGIGTNGKCLVASSTATYGLSWETCTPTAISSLNGLTGATQTFATSSVASGFNITSSGTQHTFNIGNAGVASTGLLSSTDWGTFNGKQVAYTNLTSIGSLANASGWLHNNGSGTFAYSTPTYSEVGAQQSNTNLSSLAGLTYASASFVKMTNTNTFSLDTTTYEPSIPVATTSNQYWSGNKSWQTLNSTAVGLGSVSNALQLVAANNLSDLVSTSTARTNLGVAIGTNVQAYNAGLADIASLAKTDSNIIVGNGTNWVAESNGTARTSLGVAIGSNVQAWDADLDTLAGLAKTKGNIVGSSGTDWTALGVGTNGQYLTASSGAMIGIAWTTSTASVPTTITVADTVDTNSYVALFEEATGDLGPKTDTGITYNAGTGVLTATGFSGPLTGAVTGNASTATALASDPADCGANTWANAINASGTLTCSAVTYAGITAMTSANFAGIISDETGIAGKLVFDTSPTLITPIIGSSTATSINGVVLTNPGANATLTLASGKTLTANNTLAFSGTDGTTFTFPSSSGNVLTRTTASSSKAFFDLAPATTDNITLFRADAALTVDKVACVNNNVGDTVTWQMYHATTRATSSGVFLFAASNTTTSATTPTLYTTFSDATLAAGEVMWFIPSAASSSAIWCEVYYEYD